MYLEEHSKARDGTVVAVVCRGEAREDVARRPVWNYGIGQRRAALAGTSLPLSRAQRSEMYFRRCSPPFLFP